MPAGSAELEAVDELHVLHHRPNQHARADVEIVGGDGVRDKPIVNGDVGKGDVAAEENASETRLRARVAKQMRSSGPVGEQPAIASRTRGILDEPRTGFFPEGVEPRDERSGWGLLGIVVVERFRLVER